MKVLPRGSTCIPGVILGYPTLDKPPYGLGHRPTDHTHYFEEPGVHLPRAEIPRRIQMRREVDSWAGNGQADMACTVREGIMHWRNLRRSVTARARIQMLSRSRFSQENRRWSLQPGRA